LEASACFGWESIHQMASAERLKQRHECEKEMTDKLTTDHTTKECVCSCEQAKSLAVLERFCLRLYRIFYSYSIRSE